jgi:RimJ/RimL family protein N-acetyltransferase
MTGANLPVFRTPRLILRQRVMADLGDCLAMDRDPEVGRFIAGPWDDPEAHRAFVEERIRGAYPPGMGYWTILAATGFVGWVLLTPLDLTGPDIELGWRIRPDARGNGYATEAARPVLAYALGTLRLPRLVADIDPANTPSLHVARKLGFRCEGPITYAGRMVDRYAAGDPVIQHC